MHQAAHAALADSDHDDHFHRYHSHDLYEHRRHSAYSADPSLEPSLTNHSQYLKKSRPHSIDISHRQGPHHPSKQRDRHRFNQWDDFRETSGQLLHDIETHQRLEQCSRLRAKTARDTLLPIPPPPRRIPVILRHMETPFLVRSEKKVPHGGLPFHIFQSYECLYGTLQMQAAALFPKLEIPADPAEGVVTARVVLIDGTEEREACRADWGLEFEELRAGVYDRVFFDFLAERKKKKVMISKERSLDEKTQIVTTRLRDGRSDGKNLSFPNKNAWSLSRRLLGVLGRRLRSSCCSSSSCLDNEASHAPAREDGTVEEKTNPNHEVSETVRPSSSASALKAARDPTRLHQRRRTLCGDSTKPTIKTPRPSRTGQSQPGAQLAEETPLLRSSDGPRKESRTRCRKEESERDLVRKQEKRTRYDDCRYGYPYFL
ncbi:hypothetical protein NU219Hw_g5550t1 [Hortaea werneckii]